MKSIREQIEEGIVSTLSAELKASDNPATGYLAFVGDYNGEFEGDELDDLHRRVNGQFPAVLVEAGGSSISGRSVTKKMFTRNVSVAIYVCSANLRSRESRLRNDAAFNADTSRDPGLFQTVEHIHDLIAGSDLSLEGVGPAEPEGEEPFIKAPNVTIWRVSFEFATDANVEPWDNGNGQVLTSYFLKSQLSDHPADAAPNPIVTAEGTIP